MQLLDIQHVFLPYKLVRLDDGRYIILNQNKKPLGVSSREWMDYEGHPSAIALDMAPQLAARLSYNADPGTDVIYLYGRSCSPRYSEADRAAYFDRLAVLMNLDIVTP